MEANNHVSVNILDKPYQVKCPPENVQELQSAANYVDQKMREIRDSGWHGRSYR